MFIAIKKQQKELLITKDSSLNMNSQLKESISGLNDFVDIHFPLINKSKLSTVLKEIETCKLENKPYQGYLFTDYHLVNAEIIFNDNDFRDKYAIYLKLTPESLKKYNSNLDTKSIDFINNLKK